MPSEPFALDRTYRPKRPKVKGENNPNSRQAVLFSGMDLLPGQMDLFVTDGKEQTPANCSLCDEPVASPDSTPCGLFHPACGEKHATACESCRRDCYPQ